MSGDQTVQLVGAVTMLTLVGSSLLSPRLPLGQLARMIAGWLLIFAAVLIGYSYRFELNAVVQRVTGDLLGERGQAVGDTLHVPMAPDGHFWVRARVNGHEQRFLIDSGATMTALSTEAAAAAELKVESGGLPVVIQTANGAIRAQRARIHRLSVGPILSSDLAAVVSPAFGDMNVLGMNFLSSMDSWRVEKGILILQPHKHDAAAKAK